MAPAPFAVRPKILPEELIEGVLLLPTDQDSPQPFAYDESPSSVCATTPQTQNLIRFKMQKEETVITKEDDMSDEKPQSSLSTDGRRVSLNLSPTKDGGDDPQQREQAETSTGQRILLEEETTRAGNLFNILTSGATHPTDGASPARTGTSTKKTEGNLSRLLAPTAGKEYENTDQVYPLVDNSSTQTSLDPVLPLLVRGTATESQKRSFVDLGPVSIGLYPSKDPNTESSVVVLPDRRRHRQSFDGSVASLESLLPQIQVDPSQNELLLRGSSAASLASSSNSCVLSRQSSRLPSIFTPPTSIGGTPQKHQFTKNDSNGLGEPPPIIADNDARLSACAMSMESQNSRNFAPVYSAIGSLEDPTKFGSYKMKRKNGAKDSKRDFPSLVDSKKNRKAASNRRLKDQAKDVVRRNSFENPSALKVSPESAIQKIPEKQPGKNHAAKDRRARASRRKEKFRPSSDAYTPRIENRKDIKYMPAEMRTPVVAGSMGTLDRPNYSDALRRVAMIIRQHIVKIESRFEEEANCYAMKANKKADGLFSKSMKDIFAEDKFIIPRFRCTMVRVPMAVTGMACGMKRIRETYSVPTEAEIYDFASKLFKAVQLSSECSIVSLIYIERLMETAHVPLLASTWRPIFMSGLLMASKVWQDLSSWNVEFSGVYPQYSLESISQLELQFLRMVKWDLYISSSLYAKYYFALRSLDGKHDFRKRYNHMVGGDSVRQPQARKIEERTRLIKEEALLQLSRST